VSCQMMYKDNELSDAPRIINSIDPSISVMERMFVTGRSTGSGNIVTKSELVERCREKTRRMMGS
ncbi:MAG TPA: NADH dehydrogenase subunit, partial [Synergistaceae bacterium]|nr:NADH dehydrogenase subunit [Synergistaceae bacterium]